MVGSGIFSNDEIKESAACGGVGDLVIRLLALLFLLYVVVVWIIPHLTAFFVAVFLLVLSGGDVALVTDQMNYIADYLR